MGNKPTYEILIDGILDKYELFGFPIRRCAFYSVYSGGIFEDVLAVVIGYSTQDEEYQVWKINRSTSTYRELDRYIAFEEAFACFRRRLVEIYEDY